MPDLTEEEKRILRQAYEIKERIKAEQLEAGEVSVDEAVEEELEPDMPVQRSRRQQTASNSTVRLPKHQQREGYSLSDETQSNISQPDERDIYGPEAPGSTDRENTKRKVDSQVPKKNDGTKDAEKKTSEAKAAVKSDHANVKPASRETKVQRKRAQDSQPQRSEQKNAAAQEAARVSRKRLNEQMVQTDHKWEREKRQKRSKKMIREEKREKKVRKKKSFTHKLLKVLIIVLIVAAVLLGSVYVFLRTTIAQTNYKPYETSYERQADVLTQKGVTNILLIGTDTRVAGSNDARSDAMIVVSINPYKRRLVMTSIMRDSYVTIPGYGENRINEAYSRGGAALLIQTIEENYKLGIDYYAQVDFFSFVSVIDAFGGITINVDQEEVQWINGYIAEYNQVSGIEDRDGFVDEQFAGGEITLTGKQALGYARIRKIGNDFARTQRQRTVMNALLEKVEKANIFTIYKAVESILPDISTNISDSKMCLLLMQSVLYLNYDRVQARVPEDGTWSNAIMGENQEVLAVDFGANKNYLQSTIYD